MPSINSIRQSNGRSITIFLALAAIGAAFIYESYHAALDEYAGGIGLLLLLLSFILPEIIIWLLAAVGAVRLKNYAMSIRDSDDGLALDYVANSLLLFVLYVVLVSIGGTIVDAAAGSTYEKLTIALTNHIPLAIILVAAILLWIGSKKLLKMLEQADKEPWVPSLRFCVTTVIFTTFALIFTINFYYFAADIREADGMPRFALSPALLLATYVLPHLLAWLFGLLACVNLATYARSVTGVIYKDLFKNLLRGVVIVFLCTFLAQVLLSTITVDEPSPVLVTVYGVLLLYLYGFYLVYKGTKNLERLEQ